MEYAKKPHKNCEPIHLHLAHQQELKQELARSESILQKLGNFAALINQMIVQSLVTVIQQDVFCFLNIVLKVIRVLTTYEAVSTNLTARKIFTENNFLVTSIFQTLFSNRALLQPVLELIQGELLTLTLFKSNNEALILLKIRRQC